MIRGGGGKTKKGRQAMSSSQLPLWEPEVNPMGKRSKWYKTHLRVTLMQGAGINTRPASDQLSVAVPSGE